MRGKDKNIYRTEDGVYIISNAQQLNVPFDSQLLYLLAYVLLVFASSDENEAGRWERVENAGENLQEKRLVFDMSQATNMTE